MPRIIRDLNFSFFSFLKNFRNSPDEVGLANWAEILEAKRTKCIAQISSSRMPKGSQISLYNNYNANILSKI
jgi:hypothetical protein